MHSWLTLRQVLTTGLRITENPNPDVRESQFTSYLTSAVMPLHAIMHLHMESLPKEAHLRR
jgi:hypothetical protein